MGISTDDYEYCDMPMVRCPHCRMEFQWDDHYDIDAGHTRDCPKCEKVIHVLRVDTTINVILAKDPED